MGRKSLTALAGLLLCGVGQAAPPASDALAVGDCTSAVNAPDVEAPTGALALALAWCRIQLDRPDLAIAHLSGVGPGPLRPYAMAVQGKALLDSAQPLDAVQALQSALGDTRLAEPVRGQARFWLAQALVEVEDLDGARTALNALLTRELGIAGRLPRPGGLDPAEVRWRLADTAVRRGATDRAIPVWQTIWTHNPTSKWSEAAAAKLVSAGAPPTASTALVEVRIKTLEKLFRYKDALALREKLGAGHAARGPRALARATFKARDYQRSATITAALGSRSADEELRLALARLRSGDYSGAMTQYQQMAQPGHPSREMATWKLGYTAYDSGHLDEAVELMGTYLRRYPQGRYVTEARWFRAMASLRNGDTATAKARLVEVASRHPKYSAGATYWLGRLAEDGGAPTVGQAHLQTVLQRWPSSGYAWFAANRLNRTWARKATVAPPAPTAALKGVAWDVGTALSHVGLYSWARPHLEGLTTTAKKAGKDSALALAHALIAAGSYRTAQALARPHCRSAHKGGDPIAQQACHPRPSGDRVSALAMTAGLPGSLPFAIMTAESALKPGVTSPAGARGLMQLMPELAERLHPKVWPTRPYSEDDLYQPAYNATLGTTELTELAQTFGDAGVQPGLPLVIAGYNGGSDAVTRWLSAWPEPPAGDLWAENIGYTETRKYVGRVLGFLQTYRYVYGD